ncbi:MAG: hypothetical protein U0521_26380 [Anaerolineae bacterium]
MRIRVNRDFGGRITDERRIPPGEYALDDPALFGVGQYLLDNGFAERVSDGSVSINDTDVAGEIPDGAVVTYWETEAPDDVPETVDYAAMTIAELKALLDERGVDYSDAKRKDDYVALAEAQG